MKAMVVRKAGEPFVPEERETPSPGPGQVRIKVRASGVCRSDELVAEGMWPGLQLPRVPGHEVAGTVDALGEGVTRFKVGEKVGVGWQGGYDGTCDACLRGNFVHCHAGGITGITLDGGYQESMVIPAEAVARMPEGLSFAEAAPLLCAGVTTYNSLRNAGARSGDLVAVQGLGGLGHLGVQFARAMGFQVVAVSRGTGKEEFARKLGAHHYVDSDREGAAGAIAAMGGARVFLATAPHAGAISKMIPALAIEGVMIVVAAPFEPLQVGAVDLISRSARIQGWASGSAVDSTDTMAFAARHGIKPMIEIFPLAEARKAYAKMMDGSVRFRSVLELG